MTHFINKKELQKMFHLGLSAHLFAIKREGGYLVAVCMNRHDDESGLLDDATTTIIKTARGEARLFKSIDSVDNFIESFGVPYSFTVM